MAVCLVGIGDTIYLTVQHLTGQSVRCAIVVGCSAVLSSRYATMWGIPTAVYGLIAYFVAFSCSTLALFGSRQAVQLLRLIVAAMFGMTLWLLYLQAFVLHSFCTWCLISAGATSLLVIILLAAGRSRQTRV